MIIIRISEILQLFQSYALLGIIAAVLLSAVFLFVYNIVYKRLMKGQRRISFVRFALCGLFLCYSVVVLGAVFLSWRPSGIYATSMVNFWLFSSYRSAWFTFSIVEWRNILLNIAMFVPLGIFLPFLSNKLQKIWIVVGIALASTVLIECTQLITGRGIFEIDDIFNNSLGTMIGFGMFKAAYMIAKDRPFRNVRFAGWLSPLLLTVIVFAGIFGVYELQEFGNMPQTCVYRQDMKNIALVCEISLSENAEQAKIYATSGIASEEQTKAFAVSFFASLGAVLDETMTDTYDETVMYRARIPSTGQEFHLWVNYLATTYWYTDFSSFDFEPDIIASEDTIR